MHKSSAKMILISLCFQGMLLVPAFAQSVTPADGRVGIPLDGPGISTASYTSLGRTPALTRPITSLGRKIRLQ